MFNGMNGLEILKNWPRYESGESVGFGNDVSRHGEDFEANVIALYRDGSFSLNFWAYSKGERVKRPVVLASDGEPLGVGQTVWDGNGDELVIVALEDGGHTVACRYADVGDGIPIHGMWSPSDLTHQRPDTWQRIEEDALNFVEDNSGIPHDQDQMERDMLAILRRCRALAERERDE